MLCLLIVAHIFEMTGRSAAGVEFLLKTEQDWHLGGQATHIYWHWGLMHVERGAHADALALFEKTLETAKRDDASGARSMGKCVNDLASLLFRLHLDGASDQLDLKHWCEAKERCGGTGMEEQCTKPLAESLLALPRVGSLVGKSTGAIRFSSC